MISKKDATVIDRSVLSYGEVLSLWQTEELFREFFVVQLVSSPFRAFRWETPPVTSDTVTRPFEFVLLQADALDRPVDPTAFASHFDSAANRIVLAFPSLRGDATMIVPCPVGEDGVYGHLASFVSHAPCDQVHELWKLVGRTMSEQVSDKPIWLSTAGMGVSWLHVRLDSRPKYYGHRPYAQPK